MQQYRQEFCDPVGVLLGCCTTVSIRSITARRHRYRGGLMDLALSQRQHMIVMVRQFVARTSCRGAPGPRRRRTAPYRLRPTGGKNQGHGAVRFGHATEFGGPDIDLITRCLIAIECSQHRAGLYAPATRSLVSGRRSSSRLLTHKRTSISIPCCVAKKRCSLAYQNRRAVATRRACHPDRAVGWR